MKVILQKTRRIAFMASWTYLFALILLVYAQSIVGVGNVPATLHAVIKAMFNPLLLHPVVVIAGITASLKTGEMLSKLIFRDINERVRNELLRLERAREGSGLQADEQRSS